MVSLQMGSLQTLSAKPPFLISLLSDAGHSIGGRVKTEDIVRCCGLDGTAAQRTRQSRAQHTQQRHRRHGVVGRRSRGWSFRFGTLHQSCACTHRHRIWFLFCLSSQQACDFILRRHQCLCFSRGMVPVPMVGLRSLSVWHRVGGSTRGVSKTPSPSDTYFSGGSKINTSEFARRTFWHVCFEMEPNHNPGACTYRALRCPARLRVGVLGDHNSVQKEVNS